MRVYKEKWERRKVEHSPVITCDMCGDEYDGWDRFNNTDSFEVDDFDLSWRTGTSFPEGGSTTTMFADICHKCRPTVVDILQTHGVVFQEKESDY